MKKKPLYRSIRASYSRDIYMPFCGVVAAPVVMLEVSCREDLKTLISEKPPQDVILHINAQLQVTDREDLPIGDLEEVLVQCGRSVPVLYFDSEETADALAVFVDENNLGDALLCTPYEKRHILASAYMKMPWQRGMLDARGVQVNIGKLPGEAVSNGATSVILPADAADEESVNSLQRRFIHVITTDERGFGKTAVTGINGIITKNLEEAYEFLAAFPEGSVFRRKKLFAHKGFDYEGKYSENTITSVVAAGKYHFDGAEIDIKLTTDDVPVVMHNTNTVGLFDCEKKNTEECTYAELASLRRIGFPEESIDRFEDLMHAMKEYTETPVLIEIKPGPQYWNVEELVRQMDEILSSPESQQNCICIMGEQGPGLEYVHNRLPYLPLCRLDVGLVPPNNRTEAEDYMFRIAKLSRGLAGGYNIEDVKSNRLLKEYTKFRMVTVFPWSKSWTLEPSKWEENGPENCKTYLEGTDAWTTNHGEKFLDMPVRITPLLPENAGYSTECAVAEIQGSFQPMCHRYYRDGKEEIGECDLLVLSGNVHETSDGRYAGSGKATVMYCLKIDVYFGESYRIYTEPVELLLD